MQNDPGMPEHRYSIPLYLGAGLIATASHYATTIATVELGGFKPFVATGAGFAVGAGIKYWLNYVVAFRSTKRHSTALPRFALMLALLFALNLAFFAAFNQWLGLHYIVALVLTTGTLIPPGYLLSRLWVFRCDSPTTVPATPQ